jgi:hypothetical protein
VVTFDVRVHRVVDGVGVHHMPERDVKPEEMEALLRRHAALPGYVKRITVIVDREGGED